MSPLKRLALLLLPILMVACHNGDNGVVMSDKPTQEEMSELNKYLIEKDKERIASYIERKGLSMTETEMGLWYVVLEEGHGRQFGDSDRIVFDYECDLLDGTRCYSSSETGPKDIVLGKSSIEAGLDMGLRLLRPGGEAIFIIPPFLAYGLKGDGKMIPSRSVIVYRVTIAD